jgi:hypothetical protein
MRAHQWLLVAQSGGEGRRGVHGPAVANATATLRKNPRRLVRLIGDPAENSRHASTDMVIQSSGDDSVNCGLEANEPDVAGTENLRFHGHTSWEMCRYDRFEIPLRTGRSTRI